MKVRAAKSLAYQPWNLIRIGSVIVSSPPTRPHFNDATSSVIGFFKLAGLYWIYKISRGDKPLYLFRTYSSTKTPNGRPQPLPWVIVYKWSIRLVLVLPEEWDVDWQSYLCPSALKQTSKKWVEGFGGGSGRFFNEGVFQLVLRSWMNKRIRFWLRVCV